MSEQLKSCLEVTSTPFKRPDVAVGPSELVNKLNNMILAGQSKWNYKCRGPKLRSLHGNEPDGWIYPRYKVSWWLWSLRSLQHHVAIQDWVQVRKTLLTIIDKFGVSRFPSVVWNVITLLSQHGLSCTVLAKAASIMMECSTLHYELITLDSFNKLLIENESDSIENLLQHLFSRGPTQRKLPNAVRKHIRHVLTCYEGLLHYTRWKRDPMSFESEAFLKMGAACFGEVLQHPGIWDFIIPPYVDMMMSSGDIPSVFNALVQYLKSNPVHGNAVCFMYNLLSSHGSGPHRAIVLEHLVMYCPCNDSLLEWMSEFIKAGLMKEIPLSKVCRLLLLLSLRADEGDLKDSPVLWECMGSSVLYLCQCHQMLIRDSEPSLFEENRPTPDAYTISSGAEALAIYRLAVIDRRHAKTHFDVDSDRESGTEILYNKGLCFGVIWGHSEPFFQFVSSLPTLTDSMRVNLDLVRSTHFTLSRTDVGYSGLSLKWLLQTELMISQLERLQLVDDKLQRNAAAQVFNPVDVDINPTPAREDLLDYSVDFKRMKIS